MNLSTKIAKIVEKIIPWSFYILFFTVPLIFNPSRTTPSYELFEWNKMMLVYFLTTLITTAWIIRMIVHRKILLSKTALDLPLILFFIIQTLATLFSIDRHVSFFGYYSRFHGGLLSTICYLLLYYAFWNNQDLIKLKNLLIFILSSSVILTIYGILERFGIDANMWVQDVRARVFSTFGQPNWLAAYLTILLPITISIIFIKLYNISNNSKKFSIFPFLRWTNNFQFSNIFIGLLGYWSYWIIGILFYLCLLFTKSRSGFLAFWISIALFWIGLFLIKHLQLIKSKIMPKPSLYLLTKVKPHKFFIIINCVFLIINFFVRTPIPQYNQYLTLDLFQKNQPVEETKAPVGDSIINVGITDSADIRRIVWKGAIDITKAYPLFGTGPETFAYAYYKFRPAEHNLTSEWDFLYNKAHNEFLNYAATSGFLGLGTYLLVIGWTFFIAIENILKNKDSQSRLITLGLISAYLSILITNFFGFSVVVVGIYFFLIPVVIQIINNSQIKKNKLTISNLSLSGYLELSGSVLICLVIFFILTSFWFADSFYAKAYSLSRAEKYADSYNYIKTANLIRPGEPVYHDERANITANLASEAFDNNDATQSANLSLEALNESAEALKISPQNVNFWKTRTRVLFLLSQINSVFLKNALDSILVTEELAPTDAKVAYNVGIIYGRNGKTNEAITALQKTIALKPDYRDAYIALSIFYEENNQKDKAKETLQQVLQLINPNDQEVKARIEKL